jgi:hypothetical protein
MRPEAKASGYLRLQDTEDLVEVEAVPLKLCL